jgi:putative membrane protein
MWNHHADWMWGTGGLYMGLGWILIVIVLAVVVWLLVRGPLATGGQTERRSALDVLKERYARGEIEREEFEQKKRDLES